MAATSRNIWPWLTVVIRLGLAVVWIWAGLAKISDLDNSARSVQAYEVMPMEVARAIGYMLPFVEIALGIFLVLGLAIRFTGLLSALLMVLFIAGISQAWARGLSIDCGCFGDGGYNADATSKYPWDIARDTGFLLLSAVLVWRPASHLSLDKLLMPAAYAEQADD